MASLISTYYGFHSNVVPSLALWYGSLLLLQWFVVSTHILLFHHVRYILLVIMVSVPMGGGITLAIWLGNVKSIDYGISVGGQCHQPSYAGKCN